MNTYNVTNSNDSGAGSLRNAIEQANLNAGADIINIEVDTININSEIQISDSVEIKGNEAVITQAGEGGILYIDDLVDENYLDVTLSNLTLTGGNNIFEGGAISTWENLTLDTVTVKDNIGSGFGGGLYAYGGTIIINDSIFESNEVVANELGDESGGAIAVEGIANITIDNSIFRNNISAKQAVVIFGSILNITNSEITNNIGSGLVTSGGQAFMTNILVSDNSSTGMFAVNGSRWTVESSTIRNNDGGELAGGLAFVSSVADISNTLIEDNTSTEKGGGVYLGPGSGITLTDSVITNNSAPDGSGIKGENNSTNADITDSYINGNTGGEQIVGFNLTYQGTNVDNPLGVEPADSVGYTAPVEEPPVEEPPVEEPPVEEPPVEEPAKVLNLELTEVHRFYQFQKGFHFYTADDNENNIIQDESKVGNLNYNYEGESFTALSSNLDTITGEVITEAKEVYRFFNKETGAHLFTMDVKEKDYILENLDNYSLEGTAYYAFESAPTEVETIPVYRMLNSQTGTHLLTADQREFDYVQDNLNHFTAEGDNGVAFYVMEL